MPKQVRVGGVKRENVRWVEKMGVIDHGNVEGRETDGARTSSDDLLDVQLVTI